MRVRAMPYLLFQSTLSMRRATVLTDIDQGLLYISIHALHEESDDGQQGEGHGVVISIHALHEESDISQYGQRITVRISIHALHEESDFVDTGRVHFLPFQSTLSMRRATTGRPYLAIVQSVFQSTLSMRRATHQYRFSCAGGEFQSTLSMRRATFIGVSYACQVNISIHALHEESDLLLHDLQRARPYFNPRSP